MRLGPLLLHAGVAWIAPLSGLAASAAFRHPPRHHHHSAHKVSHLDHSGWYPFAVPDGQAGHHGSGHGSHSWHHRHHHQHLASSNTPVSHAPSTAPSTSSSTAPPRASSTASPIASSTAPSTAISTALSTALSTAPSTRPPSALDSVYQYDEENASAEALDGQNRSKHDGEVRVSGSVISSEEAKAVICAKREAQARDLHAVAVANVQAYLHQPALAMRQKTERRMAPVVETVPHPGHAGKLNVPDMQCKVRRRSDGAELFLHEEELLHARCPPGHYLHHAHDHGRQRLRDAMCEAKARGKLGGNKREGTNYTSRGYATFESKIWPKDQECQTLLDESWHKNNRGTGTPYRPDHAPRQLTKLVSQHHHGAEFHKIWKVASNSFDDYLASEYRGSFQSEAVTREVAPGAVITAAVREPIGRWVSSASELLERSINAYCPGGPCSEVDSFKGKATMDYIEHTTRWYRTLNNSAGGYDPLHLRDLLEAMVRDTACNYNSYASEHLTSQATFLTQNAGFAANVSVVMKLEQIGDGLAELSRAIRHGEECTDCELVQQNSKFCKPNQDKVPSSEEMMAMLESNPELMQELCLVYAQDFICFDYELPRACEGMF